MFSHLKQKKLFENFADINRIPRCSYYEEQISNYLFDRIKSLGIECTREDCGNIIAVKPATKGYEEKGGVVLQAHMDMVCVKSETSVHDFTKDPIEMYLDGNLLRAKGTTLGADNGIGVAMILTILEDNSLSHPEITAFITVSEETGMDGAILANYDLIHAKSLINLDSEEDTAITVACSGGADFTMKIPVDFEEVGISGKAYQINILDVYGGHSGVDINKKGASAIKLLNRLMLELESKRIYEINAGTKRNAIPVCACCKFITDMTFQDLKNYAQKMQEVFRSEYIERDPNIRIEVKEVPLPEKVFTSKMQDDLLTIMNFIPHGVAAMAQNMEDLVETSSNFAIIEQQEDHLALYTSIRSSVKSKLNEMMLKMKLIAKTFDLEYKISDGYPAWEYKTDNKLLKIAKESYFSVYGKEPRVMSIHAGLECAFFAQKLPDVDMISFGPNIYNPHTIDEYTEISSVEKNYEYLIRLISDL